MIKITVITIAALAFADPGVRAFGLSASAQGTTQAQMGQMMQPQACPMKVPNADVASADTKDGVALTFSAKSKENVADLRQRVQQMAKMHEAMSGMAGMSGMPMGQGHM